MKVLKALRVSGVLIDTAGEGKTAVICSHHLLEENDPELTLADKVNYDVQWNWAEGKGGWLIYTNGALKCKRNPPFIDKMVRLARDLGAEVQGDDGEIYLEGGLRCCEPEEAEQQAQIERSWLEKLLKR